MRRERQEYLKQQSLKQRQLAIAAAKALADGVVHEREVNMFCFVGFSFGPFLFTTKTCQKGINLFSSIEC
jgi:hypothetical protein